ncbi:MAG: signal peptide peptidase SppA [Candidatus Binatia bacterium]
MRRRRRYLLIVAILVVGAVLITRRALRGPAIPANSYLVLEIGGSYAEGPPQDLVGRLLRRRTRTLIDLLGIIREARVDQRLKGVIVRISALEIGWAKTQDVRDALLEFKQSGKPLLALLQPEAGGNMEYYLATAADRIYLSPDVTTPLTGLASQFVFLGGLWDKVDIQMNVEKIGEYKTAGDALAGKEMTAAHREMANALLDSLNAQFVDGLARGRGLAPERIVALIDQAPVSPAELETLRLSDGTKHLDDIHDELGNQTTPLVPMRDYVQVTPRSLGLGQGPRIAVVYAAGTIVMGEGGTSVQGETVGADTLSQALAEAADDADARAIVLRIDSPGGSALASDVIWRATQQARAKKPLIVSMSDVAGSGGYYIAAGANRIVAQPATLTGSIGVLTARPNVRGLLARLGVNTQTITRGQFADLEAMTEPLTAAGRQKLLAELDHIYRVFVTRVATGRQLSAERVDEIGRGRVWTGAQARENGLADELGGFQVAIQAAKAAAGIEASQEVELTYYPQAQGLLDRVGGLLSGHAALDLPPAWQDALRQLLPPFAAGTPLTLMAEMVEVR